MSPLALDVKKEEFEAIKWALVGAVAQSSLSGWAMDENHLEEHASESSVVAFDEEPTSTSRPGQQLFEFDIALPLIKIHIDMETMGWLDLEVRDARVQTSAGRMDLGVKSLALATSEGGKLVNLSCGESDLALAISLSKTLHLFQVFEGLSLKMDPSSLHLLDLVLRKPPRLSPPRAPHVRKATRKPARSTPLKVFFSFLLRKKLRLSVSFCQTNTALL